MSLTPKPLVVSDKVVKRVFKGRPNIYADVDINQIIDVDVEAFTKVSSELGAYTEGFTPTVTPFTYTGATFRVIVNYSGTSGKYFANKVVFNIPTFTYDTTAITVPQPPTVPNIPANATVWNAWYADILAFYEANMVKVFLIADKVTTDFSTDPAKGGVTGPSLVSPLPSSDVVEYKNERVSVVLGKNTLPTLTGSEEVITVLFATCWLQDLNIPTSFPLEYRYDVGYLYSQPDITTVDVLNTPFDFMPKTSGVISFLQKYVLSNTNQVDFLKSRLEALELLLVDDADTIINNIKDIVDAFSGIPEGVGKVLDLLNNKINLDASNLNTTQKNTLRANLSLYTKSEVDALLNNKLNIDGTKGSPSAALTTTELGLIRTALELYSKTQVDSLLSNKANINGTNITNTTASPLALLWLNNLGKFGNIVHSGHFLVGRLGYNVPTGNSHTSFGVTWTSVAPTAGTTSVYMKQTATVNGNNLTQFLWTGGALFSGGPTTPGGPTRAIIRVYNTNSYSFPRIDPVSGRRLKKMAWLVEVEDKDEPNMWWSGSGAGSQYAYFSTQNNFDPVHLRVFDVGAATGNGWVQDLFWLDLWVENGTKVLSDITNPGPVNGAYGRKYEVHFIYYY